MFLLLTAGSIELVRERKMFQAYRDGFECLPEVDGIEPQNERIRVDLDVLVLPASSRLLQRFAILATV